MGAAEKQWASLDELAAAVMTTMSVDAPTGDDALRRAALVAGATGLRPPAMCASSQAAH
jgi:hypothetical protein